MVTRLTDAGFDALEVAYPYTGGESRYADITISDAAELATVDEFLRTSSSNCHSPDSRRY
jgi:hypothetical protein